MSAASHTSVSPHKRHKAHDLALVCSVDPNQRSPSDHFQPLVATPASPSSLTNIASLPPQVRALNQFRWDNDPLPFTDGTRNQTYFIFVALKQQHNHRLSRSDLISNAIDQDMMYSRQHKTPLVFSGKTPRNSASSILTNNRGRHFRAIRLGSDKKSFHYEFAFDLSCYSTAIKHYQAWMKALIDIDWPAFFTAPTKPTRQPPALPSPPTQPNTTCPTSDPHSPPSFSPSLDSCSLPNSPKKPSFQRPGPLIPEPSSKKMNTSNPLPSPLPYQHVLKDDVPVPQQPSPSPCTFMPALPTPPYPTEFDDYLAKRLCEFNTPRLKLIVQLPRKPRLKAGVDRPATDDVVPFTSWPLNLGISESLRQPLSSSSLTSGSPPTCWQDLLQVDLQLDKGRHRVFARRRLPANFPLGFFLGVPTSRREYDLSRPSDHSKHYALLFDDTILDGTVGEGQLYTNSSDPNFCPIHFITHVDRPSLANVLFLRGAVPHQVICWTSKTIEPNEQLFVCLAC
ncbi:hypothetical protein DM01DRAFT_1332613 [Hesseltinella vesiculosa]|uniref:SET domain-containing protein n=1 Tax=Hesseltinella vesiculosa TaxID=101127 RepID=A0A1X2GSH5_9FUNG|nr:hypothetical protein DM01DRAFT_1332613 [Hesseltinella vesiculosa]